MSAHVCVRMSRLTREGQWTGHEGDLGEEDDPEEEEPRAHTTRLPHRPEIASPARRLGGLGGVGRFVMVLHCGLKIV